MTAEDAAISAGSPGAERPAASSWTGAGLLFVTSRPPTGRDEEFHEWYEEEHIPARTKLAGWLTARRYISQSDPAVFLALYDLADLAVLQDPQYIALRSRRSVREEEIMQASEFVDRRIYRLLPSVGVGWGQQNASAVNNPGMDGRGSATSSVVATAAGPVIDSVGVNSSVFLAAPSICGELLLCVWWEPLPGTEDAFHAWYEEEHLPLLLTVPGWLRCRRLERVDGQGPRFLAVHDLAGPEVFDHPVYRRAITTERRAQVVAQRAAYDRQVFRLLRNFDPS